MAKRFFGVAVLVILALSTFGLWVTEGDHGRETGAGTAYLIAVGVSLLIVSVGGVAFTLARGVRAPRGAETGASGSESLGEGTGRQGRWAQPEEDHRAAKQQGDVRTLDVEGDPRGGTQSPDYRLGRPTELIVEGGTAMMGPAGAPRENPDSSHRPRHGGTPASGSNPEPSPDRTG
jgi:hypothetical protein